MQEYVTHQVAIKYWISSHFYIFGFAIFRSINHMCETLRHAKSPVRDEVPSRRPTPFRHSTNLPRLLRKRVDIRQLS